MDEGTAGGEVEVVRHSDDFSRIGQAGEVSRVTTVREEADPSLTTPTLHPNDQDLSLGTPLKKTSGAPCTQDDSGNLVEIARAGSARRSDDACSLVFEVWVPFGALVFPGGG